jgi:hypothetical protein
LFDTIAELKSFIYLDIRARYHQIGDFTDNEPRIFIELYQLSER